MSDFVKRSAGVVINTNKAALKEAKRAKKALLNKNKRIDELESRILVLEDLILNRMC